MLDKNYGAVFTREWVVNLMLKTCGYTPDKDLALVKAVEPSCGDGAFLLPMVEALSSSLAAFDRGLLDAADSIRAFDLQEQHVRHCRQLVHEYLVSQGWDSKLSRRVAKGWIQHADYLLTDRLNEADFVIGNPPYIRSDDMSPELRAEYMARCSTMTIGSDIFVGFIETGLRSLRPGGVLCYIVADRWMHNAYGKKLRRFVVENSAVDAVYEMHGVDAFAEDVSAYPAITRLRLGPQETVDYVTAEESFDEESAERLLKWHSRKRKKPLDDPSFRAAVLHDWFHTDSVWPSASPSRLALLEELEERFRPLESDVTGTKIGIGIATGADKVFVVHTPEVAEKERLLPLVRTEHTRTGHVDWTDTWLVNPWDDQGALVDLSRYPRMAEYLKRHRKSLSERHTARKSRSDGWYRTIDKVKPGLMASPKLLFPDMKASIQPVLDEGCCYPHHNLYWLTSEKWDLRVLGGLLLSRVAEMFVRAYGVKMRGGTLRFQAQYLRLIRVPDPESLSATTKKRLARAFDMRDAGAATEAALVAYGIDELPD